MTETAEKKEPRPLDDRSKRRLAWLIQRAEECLAEAAATSPEGRAEVHLILVQHDRTLTRNSRILPAPEHPPE